ncbi:hypothetical protein BHYA_0094g00330 [Botrytis hyacinthi]|uniref:Uncharacterized protein n=1 Tax=Botrytis hyacinthi TaxID=278943 RepID=A0A4Z1GQT4_9HELO|nr:hypothetical protein BHYA_0094g00330 [Botrytis hyacinthi]
MSSYPEAADMGHRRTTRWKGIASFFFYCSIPAWVARACVTWTFRRYLSHILNTLNKRGIDEPFKVQDVLN